VPGRRAQPIRGERVVGLPFTPEQLWPLVADTNRMDRAVGMPPVAMALAPRPEGGETKLGQYRLVGRTLARWIEYPFEWERPRRFSVVREYRSGPLLRFHGGVQLEGTAGGTRLRSFVEITPRWRWLDLPIRFGVIPVGLGRAVRQYRAIADYLAARRPEPFPELARLRTPADPARLAAALERLAAEGAPVLPTRRLGRFLAEAADEDVAGMRPLELADRWGLDRRETLETFVRAAVGGLLELRWELLCPRCRGVKASAQRLRALRPGGVCPTCSLHFVASRDEAIEARFYPAPSVRRVELGTYCLGSPAQSPHRLAQLSVAAGETGRCRLALGAGTYELSSPQSQGAARLTIGDATDTAVAVRVAPGAIEPRQAAAAAGEVELRIENSTRAPITVGLDDTRWATTGATPGRLMLLPAFHGLLSDEALMPGFELAVGRVGLLFSDLAGSTSLYERSGDARAFRLVGEHFLLLEAAIDQAGGAMVKTIGDAVMAAFPDGRSALRAALAMQRAVRGLDTAGLADPARLIKVGVHVGPCFAVTLNDRLDYFGTAVNLAARAQHEARGGEVVATQAAYAEGRAELESAGVSATPFEVQLRGFGAPMRLVRLDCARIS
jgi:class 3 adenylate cyclase